LGWEGWVVVTSAGRFKSRRARLVLALVGGVMGLLCLGGAGIVFLLYDDATKIERTAPDAVVDNFLRAYFVNRDDQEASLYQCKSGGDLSKISQFKADVLAAEKKYSLGVNVTWTSLVISTENGSTSVSTEIRRAFSDGSERVSDGWEFQLQDQDGWRVCGAAEIL
jgi:hypothetical protein